MYNNCNGGLSWKHLLLFTDKYGLQWWWIVIITITFQNRDGGQGDDIVIEIESKRMVIVLPKNGLFRTWHTWCNQRCVAIMYMMKSNMRPSRFAIEAIFLLTSGLI